MNLSESAEEFGKINSTTSDNRCSINVSLKALTLLVYWVSIPRLTAVMDTEATVYI